ncbi:HlyD family efflux transporter periplasmic adaptor subunit [Martelella alba]|uniref:HlyD family efflux transporter periplasmic adaptor subunit n=1 Tax=Martelella alba TaxID=2590451 RepID=A0A506U6B6_9HYPH|nr:HlyD family efflux transporter periplasmic adaptor subunit [Martelella alba]TPW29390.1 HlyD family efflux transporter periplasmic adaptor subunit [Martelella alba]
MTPLQKPQRRRRRISPMLIVTAICTVAAVGFAGYRYFYPKTVEAGAVSVVPLVSETLGPATLDALTMTSVASRVSGRIAAINVDEGDQVRAGEILVRLVDSDTEAAVLQAEAQLRAGQNAVVAAKADLASVSAVSENAARLHKRQQQLMTTGATTQTALDNAEADARQATAELDKARAAIAQAEGNVDAYKAALAVANANLSETVIRAPFDGIVVSRDQSVGAVVTAGVSIVQLVDPASLVLSARFDESLIARLDPGMKVSADFNGEEITGSVLRINRFVDTETREFSVDVKLDSLPKNWAIDQRARVHIAVAEQTTLPSVDKALIDRRRDVAGLWLVEHGRIHFTPVAFAGGSATRAVLVTPIPEGTLAVKPGRRLFAYMPVKPEEGGQ